MTEYWLISAPGDKTCQQTWETLNNSTSKQNSLSANYKFPIPDLKVGTLDQLVGLSDDLGKLDVFVEQTTRKVANYLGDVLEDQRDKLHENLLANNNSESVSDMPFGSGGRPPEYVSSPIEPPHHNATATARASHKRTKNAASNSNTLYHNNNNDNDSKTKNTSTTTTTNNIFKTKRNSITSTLKKYKNHSAEGSVSVTSPPVSPVSASFSFDRSPSFPEFPLGPDDLPSYITRFQWDIAKYPIKQSLRNIADIISKQVGQIDADLKTKSTAYNNLKGSLQNLEKKQTGSLLTRNLADIVKKEHFILDSEYLTTLLVIVPKAQFGDWHQNYEKITDMIVPRSTVLITQDNEYGLFSVSLFKKVVEEFKLHSREKKFVVRDFTYNEEVLAAGKNEITKLVTDKKKQFGPLVRWLKVNFSECFCAWIHVKALRVFVESVLRYGLPVNFQAVLLHPNKKNTKRLRDVLNQLYGHLDSSALQGSANTDSVDIPGLGFGQADYYPYVYYKLNIDMMDIKV